MRRGSLFPLSAKNRALRKVLHESRSIFGEFGCVHDSVVRKLRGMTSREARTFLRELWFSKREQDALLEFSHRDGADGAKKAAKKAT